MHEPMSYLYVNWPRKDAANALVSAAKYKVVSIDETATQPKLLSLSLWRDKHSLFTVTLLVSLRTVLKQVSTNSFLNEVT